MNTKYVFILAVLFILSITAVSITCILVTHSIWGLSPMILMIGVKIRSRDENDGEKTSNKEVSHA